jgi:hypothetical protein
VGVTALDSLNVRCSARLFRRQLRSGSLNLLATEVASMAQLPIALLPPEQAGGSAETGVAERSGVNQLTPEQRALAPASHDFY